MESTQDLIFEIGGNVGAVGSSDLQGVVSLVMSCSGEMEPLHLGRTLDSFEQQTGRKAKTVSRSLARTTTNIWESGNKTILRQVYGDHLPADRPTPKNFIMRLAEYLKRQTTRKQDSSLNKLEYDGAVPEGPDNLYKYFLHEMHHPSCAPSFGILVQKRFSDGWATFAVVSPLSYDKNAVALLVKKCSSLQLSPEHLLDVVHDFLLQEAFQS